MKLWRTFEGGGRLTSKYFVYIAQDCQKVADQDLDGGEIIKVQLKTFDQFLKFADPKIFHSRDIIIELLQAQLSSKKKAQLKKDIYS